MAKPILTGVTLTGADESVPSLDLFDLQREFPFVEWGILIGSHVGPRFPSQEWIHSLVALGLRLSVHICGAHLRKLLQAAILPWGGDRELRTMFSRAQLNFHGEAVSKREASVIVNAAKNNPDCVWEFIVQLDGVNDWILDELLDAGLRASGLYDRSHGAGEKPSEWPWPRLGWDVGYAGGLGPETISADLDAIGATTGQHRCWIDMETRIRSRHPRLGDYFDLQKCRRVLEACAPCIAPKEK